MNDCIDSFKTGECGCGCGCVPCLNNAKPVHVPVDDSRGDCVPLVRDPHHIVSHNCKRPVCGDKTIGAPIFTVTVENPPDDVLRNPDGSPVIIDGKVVAKTS